MVLGGFSAHLVQLETDESDGEGSRRRDGGDDLSSNQLRLVPVSLGDAVVGSPQVGRGGDEVDVVVRVVILLKVNRSESQSGQRRRRRERSDDRVDILVYRRYNLAYTRLLVTSLTLVVLRNGLVLVDLDLDAASRREFWDVHALNDLSEHRWVPLSFEAVVEGVEVGSSNDIRHVQCLCLCQRQSTSSRRYHSRRRC